MPVPPAKTMSYPAGIYDRFSPLPKGLLIFIFPLNLSPNSFFVKLSFWYFLISRGMEFTLSNLAVVATLLSESCT